MKENDPKKSVKHTISDERLAELEAMSDDNIDCSDIPELTDEFWKNAQERKPIESKA